jgi:hypothetical protein
MSLFKLRVIYNEIYLYFFKLKVKKKINKFVKAISNII